MATVSFHHVGKRFGELVAVQDFDLHIEDKEFVILVGPSGCGKSTTLRMLAGLEKITEGKIEIDGRVVNKIHPKERDIAMVFQNYALYPHMTVHKNMAFGLQLRRFPKAEIDKRVYEAADLDAKLRVQMREELLKLHQRIQTTILYVTHDQVEAMTMGSKIVIMNEGRTMQVGKPMEVYDFPNNMFVAGFTISRITCSSQVLSEALR
jgi:multiple sugar transport system ATP-binding protein